ncbi:hypothetical protein JH146_1197 [Methanocaldococcus bathoardescens]|uniref:Uncharacterized protein n=1 Tax=Methanocaldococcus bathoardescens TaxID=1301915 RepID=A0A076LKE6_9EURY|nr:hypothetical protein [Methanocaldococcus bathoardescens]AIJ06039.1 hypothetical protein JH146_1197 [Methanocaldococcus bathoardescens]
MDIGIVILVASIFIFGLIFVYCLEMLLNKMIGIDKSFKDLFNYKNIKRDDVIVTLVSLATTMLLIKLLNLKFNIMVFLIVFVVIRVIANVLFEIIVHKKLLSIKISKTTLTLDILTLFVFLYLYFVPKLLSYFGIPNQIIAFVLVPIVIVVLLLFIAMFVDF